MTTYLAFALIFSLVLCLLFVCLCVMAARTDAELDRQERLAELRAKERQG